MLTKIKNKFFKIIVINISVVLIYIALLFFLMIQEKKLEFLGIINLFFFLNFLSLLITPIIYFISRFYGDIKNGLSKVLSMISCILAILGICFYACLKGSFWLSPEYPVIRGDHLIIERIDAKWMQEKYVYFYKPTNIFFKRKLHIDPEPYSNFIPPSEAEISKKFNEV